MPDAPNDLVVTFREAAENEQIVRAKGRVRNAMALKAGREIMGWPRLPAEVWDRR